MSHAVRRRYSFRGIIQGVGFRPTIYRCAIELDLSGWVQNRRSEVVAEIQGTEQATNRFREHLGRHLPRAARIDSDEWEAIDPTDETAFRIVPSQSSDFRFPPIPPDLALCPECRRELLDPSDRRFLYPFITCTQCGPRYTIVENTPFDRETTSMVDFPQCPACMAEYTDPMHRRFHAQTNACPECGPGLRLSASDGRDIIGDPLLETIAALSAGKVVAIQGVGGFHLAVNAEDQSAVLRLRRDKERERKPFALMARDLATARRHCPIDEAAARALDSPASPIVILPALDPPRWEQVSHTATLGLMLPYSPVHVLLFEHPRATIPYDTLVMTSANLKGRPMVTDPQQGLSDLGEIADLFLWHNRRIVFRTDDSVLRPGLVGSSETGFVQIRRSRGYVPGLITLPRDLTRPVLAVGGDLKNAPAFGLGRDIYLAPYIGDLEDPSTQRDFTDQIDRILELYRLQPQAVIYDPHPLYHSSEWARRSSLEPKVEVQHHYAHLLSVMAEHGLERCIGLSFDGTGYGPDGMVWGGEFMFAERSGYQRLGHYSPFPLPGGEASVRHPLRLALAILSAVLRPEKLSRLIPDLSAAEQSGLLEMIAKGVNCPETTSLGRLFDAAAALLGFVRDVGYEGEGPIRMEGAAWTARPSSPAQPKGIVGLVPGAPFQLNAASLIEHLARREIGSGDTAELAYLFHLEIADSAHRGAMEMRKLTGEKTIALSGGVFQNTLLRELLLPRLAESGFDVYTNRAIPPGDGGLAVGQAYYEGF